MGSEGFIGGVLAGFADALEPLEIALSGPDEFAAFVADLGWPADPAPPAAQLQAAFGDLGQDLGALAKAAQTFRALPAQADVSAIATAVEQLGAAVASVASDVATLAGTAATGLPPPLDQAAFWESLAEELLGKLLYDYLQNQFPALFGILRFLGIAVADSVSAGGQRDAYTRHNIDWARLSSTVSKPGQVFADVYGWGGTFDHIRFIDNLLALLGGFGSPVSPTLPEDALLDLYYDPASPVRQTVVELQAPLYWGLIDSGPVTTTVEFSLVMLPIPASGDTTGQPVGFVLAPKLTAQAAETTALSASTELTLSGSFGSVGIVRMEVRPTGVDVAANGSGSTTTFSATAKLTASPAPPWVLLGSPGSTRLEVGAAHVALGIAGPVSAPEVTVEVAIDSGQLVLDFSESDGFLQDIFGDQPQKFAFTIGGRWSSRSGLTLNGQGRIDATIPVNQSLLGVIEIDSIFISAGAAAGQNPGAQLVLAATGTVQLGPISASVSRVGLQASASPPAAGTKGNLGDVAVAFGFKPPDGIGLGIDNSLVTGGGYLFSDPAAGLYAGAAELQLEGIGLAAVGLLTTKLPGGRSGFSLVVLISVTFPPIELGFGFALTGVGGLLAVNSTVNVTALQSGLAAGSLDAVLFPVDLASSAQRVVTELEQYFPAAPGQFVVGPAVQIIWGEDGIFTASIGVLIEFPNPLRVVLLGRLNVTLPSAIAPITEIELDVLGVVDFTAKTLGLDAVLRNSHVADFPLTGAAALRASWGAQPGFLFAAGGFNPRFAPPASFPRLAPLALSLSTSDNPRLRVSAYLAVTSNTVQVGGLLDFSAHVDLLLGTLGVAAALGIDTLFQLHPFAFFIDLHAMVAVTWNGNPVLSAQLDGTFTGPSPLYLAATATVQFLGTHHVHVELTIPGSAAPPPAPPPAVDAAAALRDALGQPSAWHSDPPPGGQHLVRLADASQGGNMVVHPLGVLTVRQRRLPLGQAIQRLGSGTLASATAFTITAASVGSVAIEDPPTVQDYFARAQFFNLSDADKLAAPSFEMMDAGVSLSSAATQVSGGQVTVTAAFTSIVVPPDGGQPATQTGKALPDGLLASCAGSAPARGPGSTTAGYLMGPPQVTLAPLDYALATGALTSPDTGHPPQRFPTYSQAASQQAAGDEAGARVVFADEVVAGPAAPAGPPLAPAPAVTGIIGPVVPPGLAQPFARPPSPKPPVPVT